MASPPNAIDSGARSSARFSAFAGGALELETTLVRPAMWVRWPDEMPSRVLRTADWLSSALVEIGQIESELADEHKADPAVASGTAAEILRYVASVLPDLESPAVYADDDRSVVLDFRNGTGEAGIAVVCNEIGDVGIFVNADGMRYRTRVRGVGPILDRTVDLLLPLSRLIKKCQNQTMRRFLPMSETTRTSAEGFFRVVSTRSH